MKVIGAPLCECGCGQQTKLISKNHTSSGSVKGQFRRYIHGHGARKHPYGEPATFQYRRKRYGLSWETMQQMLADQHFECANPGCRVPIDETTAHLDHDHACCSTEKTCGNCVRGFLCRGCNMALGNVHDNVATLRGLVEYLCGS